MQESIRKIDAADSGLTTADLANLNEPASTIENERRYPEKGNDRVEKGNDRVNARRQPYSDAEDLAASRKEISNTTKSDIGPTSTGVPGSNIVAGPAARGAVENVPESEAGSLFSAEEAKQLHSRWDAIQVSFVDEPRQAVQQADGLVANAIKRLAEIFAEERGHLDKQWDRGDDVSTEDLRVALRRYRAFFGRLLSV